MVLLLESTVVKIFSQLLFSSSSILIYGFAETLFVFCVGKKDLPGVFENRYTEVTIPKLIISTNKIFLLGIFRIISRVYQLCETKEPGAEYEQ